jgi:L-fuconolactonase
MNEITKPDESRSPHVPIRPDWLARRTEPVIDPHLPIVDAHHHLWDLPGRRYLAGDLLADISEGGHRIVATVFVECKTHYHPHGPEQLRSLGETAFAIGEARAIAESGSPVVACAGIVGHVDLSRGDAAAAVLRAHVDLAGGRFRGVRHITVWHADPTIKPSMAPARRGLMAEPAFRRGIAQLAPLGLSFDAWLIHTQIGELTDLARAFPDTTIVLDHLGGPLALGFYRSMRDEVYREWRREMKALAGCPNVRIKIGAFGMPLFGFDFDAAEDPPDSEAVASAIRPYVDACIELFGAQRCMFESNFPVDKGSFAYRTVWNAFKRLAAGASETERTALFSGTACDTYRLELSPT